MTRAFKSLSVVSTLYRSEAYVAEFYRRTKAVIEKLGIADYEFIFVNDGSPDNALQEAVKLHERDAKVTVIDLSRNFGHHTAIMTGLRQASKEAVFLIDVDLEEPPEELERFYAKLSENEQLDVVYGVQVTRRGGWWERFSGKCYYRLVNLLCDVRIPDNVITLRLMTRRYVQALAQYHERQFILVALTELSGFRQEALAVEKLSLSETSYSFTKKIRILTNTITSSSTKPLYFIFYSGILIMLFSSLYIFSILYSVLILGQSTDGWPSLIVSIWFIGGLMATFLGIIGVYVSKIYIETKARPYVHIRNIWHSES